MLYNILHSQVWTAYQLAFFTPGMLPASAFKRNWNCAWPLVFTHSLSRGITITHSCHAEVSEDTATLCAHDTAVLDLCRAGVAVHLGELELRLRARALRQGSVADNVAKRLPVRLIQSVYVITSIHLGKGPCDARHE